MNIAEFASKVLDIAVSQDMHHLIVFDIKTHEKEEKNLSGERLLPHALYHYKRGDAIKINERVFTSLN